MLEVFVEEVWRCVISQEKSGYVLSTGSKMERTKSSICGFQG